MARFDRADVIPVLVAIFLIAIVITWTVLLSSNSGAISQSFDHSECQYPERLSNPVDGCDNSDPARPECMKFGTEECDLPYLDGSEPVQQENASPAAPQAVEISNCKE